MVLFRDNGEERPKQLLRHCLVCGKKKNLIYYSTTNDYILQICNKCNEAPLDVVSEKHDE